MGIFVAFNINHSSNIECIEKKTKGLFKFSSDPSLRFYKAIFCKKQNVPFKEILQIVLKTYSRIEYLGATAFIYWTYYKEFYDFLLDVSADDKKKKLYKKAIKRFLKRTLNRWVEFVKYSDDILYPQNEYFRKMQKIISQNF